MPRPVVKGGIWKNTEDEILKAAVMKYGKNQWARISSLLVRKTPKQCKARWYEWLDPSIKKTEWSKEEEEKLLHLAKLMPCQWRTIAPIVGRTPAQCLEHYERLLDQAQGRDEEIDAADDPRRLRPGEVDPTPETKPARPDPVDMDEDEKEMLAEARARLANTQGKKAKRKAREKQLEEARRLAALQKRRELKAAGINISMHKKKRGIDYNAEIPFQRVAPAGFYDTADEKDRPEEGKFKKRWLADLEGKRRDEEEEAARKRDAQRQKQRLEQGLPALASQINKLQAGHQVKRTKLSLPAPQIDGETQIANPLLLEDASTLATPSRLLATPLHTPGETPVVNTGFAGASSRVKPTPGNRPLATPLRTPVPPGVDVKRQLKLGLSSLPKPKNEFDLIAPEDEEEEEYKKESVMEMDAADVAAKLQEEEERAEQQRLKERSQAIQRGLPRPLNVNPAMKADSNDLENDEYSQADALIRTEMVTILESDHVMHPIKGTKPSNVSRPLEPVEPTYLEQAKALLAEELGAIKTDISKGDFAEAHEAIHRDFIYVPGQQRYVKSSVATKSDKCSSAEAQLESYRAIMNREAKRAAKLENKLNVLFGGYQNREDALWKKITETSASLEQASTELETLRALADQERNGIQQRLNYLQNEVNKQATSEAELQKEYANLSFEYERMMAAVSQ